MSHLPEATSGCFVVLEPLNHMYKVIEEAADRGHSIVAFHSSPLSAAGPYRSGLERVAERHAVDLKLWNDVEGALRTISTALDGRPVVGTYAGIETVLVVDAALRERVGLPTHGAAAMERLLNKRWVRTRLREAGLSKLADFEPRTIVREGRWPLPGKGGFLKPITGGGSLHVTRCADVGDVTAGLDRWDREALVFRPIMREHLLRGGDLFLEEAATGELMSLEGWVQDGRYHALGLTSRTLLARDPSVEMGATFPYEHPARRVIEAKIGAVHDALGLVHGPTHAELIACDDGTIELVELNVRFGGSDILLLMDLTLRTPVERLLADLACGRSVAERDFGSTGHACMQQLLAPSGTASLESVDVFEDGLHECRVLKEIGAALTSTDYQSDHVATFIVRGDGYGPTLEKALAARRSARINGRVLGHDPNNAVTLR